ncbi:MAG: glycosyltransferase family 9 protein [Bacteriovoracaceae bacterium]|nr:glycosyltransferase family 9 protein [Bacteriovoracaceae bacterium]
MNVINKKNQQEMQLKTHTLAIIQITRIGDLIQTVQAVTDLRKLHSNYRLVLIARTQFAKPLQFILDQYFDKVYYLDTGSLNFNSPTGSIKNAVNSLDHFLDEIKNENIDALINLSFSNSSSYLASCISAKHKIGAYFDLNNKQQINDKWSQMLFSTVMRGSLNPYSLVDLFKNIIGVKPLSPKTTLKTIPATIPNIIMYPFASSERKVWKAEKWVEIIYKTLKDNTKCTITLVGAKNEILKSQIIVENPLLKQFSARIINITGKTTIEELSNHIASSKLFVGHDSMVGHLAAFHCIPTLTIALGNVRPQETTPYQSNAITLSPRTKCFPCFPSDSCAYTQCHHDIPYQIVNNIIKNLLEDGVVDKEWIQKSNSNFHLSSVNIYKSHFQNEYFNLENLSDGSSEIQDLFRTFYKITWSFVLGDLEDNFPFPKLTPSTHKELLDALNGLQHLFELSEFGQKYSKYILEEISSQTPSIIKIKEFSKKIDEIDNLQVMVLKTAPLLGPIVDYAKVRKGNLFGDNIVKLTESSYYCFEESAQITRIMYELLQNTIAEYKISQGKSKSNGDLNK